MLESASETINCYLRSEKKETITSKTAFSDFKEKLKSPKIVLRGFRHPDRTSYKNQNLTCSSQTAAARLLRARKVVHFGKSN